MKQILLTTKKNAVPLEKTVEAYLVKHIGILGGKAYKFKSDNNRGVSDRLCVMPFRVIVFVEVKRPGGKPTALQLKFKEDMRKLSHFAIIVDNKEAIDRFIIRLKKYLAKEEERFVKGEA